MTKQKLIILGCFLTFSLLQSFTSIGQQRTIIGKITTFNVIGVNNASIIVGRNSNETFSDTMGYYSISCKGDDKLTIKANGFFTEKVNLKDIPVSDSVNVNLKLKNGKKNISYATGYGHIDEKRLSYAIQHFGSETDYSSYRSIIEVLEGRVSGISIGNNGITIRGTNLLNGESSALLVVDGTIVSFSVFQNIPPSQLKNIDVLKGAAASARYGSRGMGGVIVVETKTHN